MPSTLTIDITHTSYTALLPTETAPCEVLSERKAEAHAGCEGDWRSSQRQMLSDREHTGCGLRPGSAPVSHLQMGKQMLSERIHIPYG